MKATFDFLCLDCKHDTFRNEYYMLHDAVWQAANPKSRGMLCIGCLERRIDRRLCPHDFVDAAINNPAQPLLKSARLLSRILGTTT